MLFPPFGMTMAIWLLMAPLLGIETGFRAELAVAAGCAALILAPLSLWSRRAAIGLAALGIVLGFANFGLVAPLGSLANMATCGVAFVVAAMAPQPRVLHAAAPAGVAVPVTSVAGGEASAATARIRVAA